MAKHKFPGLYWDKKTQQGSIDKRIGGIRVRHRFTADSQAKAEEEYHKAIAATKGKQETGKSFYAAATHYLQTECKTSLERDAATLKLVAPWIGNLQLDQIHQGTLQPFIDARREAGIKSSTVCRDLRVVSRILTLASRVWRDGQGKPWLTTPPPLFQMPDWQDDAKPYLLDWQEQGRLLKELPPHLQRMALFAINTGARQGVVCGLRWEWETPVSELGTSVFVIPGRPNPIIGWTGTKSKEDQLILLNHTARSIIDECRGNGSEWVFIHQGKPLGRMNNTAWRSAWKRAGLPVNKETLSGVHNLRHRFCSMLRAADVNLETRKALMHHDTGDVTLRYSPAEIRELLGAVEKLETAKTTTVLKVVSRR